MDANILSRKSRTSLLILGQPMLEKGKIFLVHAGLLIQEIQHIAFRLIAVIHLHRKYGKNET